jgi:hypothetical protein
MKTFHNKQKLKEFIATKQALQKIFKIFKGPLDTEEGIRVRHKNARKNKLP